MPGLELVLRFAATAVAGYLLGSIPSGVLVGKFFGNVDPRASGSGKTGATNVLRTLGPQAAAIVVIVDFGKGALAVLLARYLFFGAGVHFSGALATLHLLALYRPYAEALAGLAAVLGHTFSIFIHFTGGRGVLTGGGATVVMSPIATLIGLIAVIITIRQSRYVSLGSIIGAIVVPLVALIQVIWFHGAFAHFLFTALGGAAVILMHRDNIQRLRAGTERKIGERATAATS